MVIVPTSGDHGYLAAEIAAGVATVFALRPPVLAGGAALGDVVVADERGGADVAVAHLIAHGHRRIGYLGAPAVPGVPDALAGYRSRRLALGYADAMVAAGLPVDERWLSLTAGGLSAAGVTAVFCGSRAHTAQALHALAGAGQGNGRQHSDRPDRLGRPGRLAVIGFGDFELADLVSPGITVVSYDPARIGRTAGELLMSRLAGDSEPPRLVELPVALIPRGSGELPPSD
jgi:LacI family transcriptional regulator